MLGEARRVAGDGELKAFVRCPKLRQSKPLLAEVAPCCDESAALTSADPDIFFGVGGTRGKGKSSIGGGLMWPGRGSSAGSPQCHSLSSTHSGARQAAGGSAIRPLGAGLGYLVYGRFGLGAFFWGGAQFGTTRAPPGTFHSFVLLCEAMGVWVALRPIAHRRKTAKLTRRTPRRETQNGATTSLHVLLQKPGGSVVRGSQHAAGKVKSRHIKLLFFCNRARSGWAWREPLK